MVQCGGQMLFDDKGNGPGGGGFWEFLSTHSFTHSFIHISSLPISPTPTPISIMISPSRLLLPRLPTWSTTFTCSR